MKKGLFTRFRGQVAQHPRTRVPLWFCDLTVTMIVVIMLAGVCGPGVFEMRHILLGGMRSVIVRLKWMS